MVLLMTQKLTFFFVLVISWVCHAETVKDREGAVRSERTTMEEDPRWNWNDIDGGFRLAQSTGKPLLVVLRCVPCLSCAGIDAGVLQEPDLVPLLDQFVCVRVINANALDLSRFQFDYDLSFSTLIFNGDGTIYGRYGSWLHQKDPQNKTTSSFKKALESALAIHRDYPKNRANLAGKQGAPVPFRTPVDFPALSGKYESKLDWNGQVVKSCVHCHMIGDAYRANSRQAGKAIPIEWIYPQPSIETLGISLATDAVATIESITKDSPAAKAGLQPGDQFVSLSQQPLISIADVSWVLHRAPDSGSLSAQVQRGDRIAPVSIDLPQNWRSTSDISRRVGTWPMRAMAFGGMKMEDLDNEQRQARGLTPDQMALLITHVGQYGEHAAAKKAGFKLDDVLIEVDTLQTRTTEGTLIGHLLQKHRPGDKVDAVVLRAGKRLQLKLPQQ